MNFKITPAVPDGININVSMWVEDWDELADVMMEMERIENNECSVSIPCMITNVRDAIADAKDGIRNDLAEMHRNIIILNRRAETQ